jgi:hypothetical protein
MQKHFQHSSQDMQETNFYFFIFYFFVSRIADTNACCTSNCCVDIFLKCPECLYVVGRYFVTNSSSFQIFFPFIPCNHPFLQLYTPTSIMNAFNLAREFFS